MPYSIDKENYLKNKMAGFLNSQMNKMRGKVQKMPRELAAYFMMDIIEEAKDFKDLSNIARAMVVALMYFEGTKDGIVNFDDAKEVDKMISEFITACSLIQLYNQGEVDIVFNSDIGDYCVSYKGGNKQ